MRLSIHFVAKYAASMYYYSLVVRTMNKAPPRCHKNTTLENACSIFTKTESPRARIIPKIPAKAMLFVFKIRKSTLKKDESLLWYCFVKSTKEQLERHGFIQKARRLVQFNKLFHESPPKKTFAF